MSPAREAETASPRRNGLPTNTRTEPDGAAEGEQLRAAEATRGASPAREAKAASARLDGLPTNTRTEPEGAAEGQQRSRSGGHSWRLTRSGGQSGLRS
ncbi:hypothetical protein, partial [Herbiconiux daphne]